MIFKLYNCDCGVTIPAGEGGINYDFAQVENVQYEDPETTRLVRGANAGDKEGLIYKEGLKEAKKLTYTVIGLTKELHELLKEAYKNQTRVDAYVISRDDGSSKIAKKAILSQEPKQLNLDDSAESMNTALLFESFDVSEVHKS